MKKVLFISLIILFSFSTVYTQEEANPESISSSNPKLVNMNAFMGMKWGCTAAYFHDNFKFKDHMEIKKDTFISKNFKLAGIGYHYISFYFTNEQGLKEISQENARSWYLVRAGALLNSYDFEKLYKIYVEKYGPPSSEKKSVVKNKLGERFNQKLAVWTNISLKRVIVMRKYATKITQSFVLLTRAAKTTR